MRSLIRVDEFWITEDIEFNKSVGEKIEGLYYFNKKKYETYLKQKQVNKGWFSKKGGALKALEEKGIDSVLRELKQEDEKKEKNLRVAKAVQVNPVQKGPQSIKQMTRSGLAGPYTEIFILPPISKDLRLSGVGGQTMRPESLQDGGLEVTYDRKSLGSVESFKFNGQVATQGMSPQQLDEMNKKIVQSLNSKLLFVKQNFTSTHAESRRICDKLGDIEAILNRLVGGRDTIAQDHDDRQSNNPDEPCESKGKTFSMDLSGDLKAVSGLSDAQLEQGIGELLDSFEDKEASDKTVKNKKIQANNPYLQSKHLSIKPIVTPTDSHQLKKQNATSVDDDLRSLDDQSSIFKESQFTRKEKDDDLMIARPLNPIIASPSLGEYHKKHSGLAIKPGKTSSILKGHNDKGVSQKIKYLSAKYQVDKQVDGGGASSQMTPKHRHEKLDHTQPGLNSLMEEINRQLQENVFSAGGLGNRTPPRLSTRDRKEGSPQHRPPIKDERDKRVSLPGQRTAEQKRG